MFFLVDPQIFNNHSPIRLLEQNQIFISLHDFWITLCRRLEFSNLKFSIFFSFFSIFLVTCLNLLFFFLLYHCHYWIFFHLFPPSPLLSLALYRFAFLDLVLFFSTQMANPDFRKFITI